MYPIILSKKTEPFKKKQQKCQKLEIVETTRADVYNLPRAIMSSMVQSGYYQSNTPLEVAYRWTLACKSLTSGRIKFLHEPEAVLCNIKFENVVAGRIFDGNKAIQINGDVVEKRVQKNTLYHVQDSKKRKRRTLEHILCLICFSYAKLKTKIHWF